MTNDPLEIIRDQLTSGVAGSRARTRRRRSVAAATMVVVLPAVTCFALAAPWSGTDNDDVVASEGPDSTRDDDRDPDGPTGLSTGDAESVWAIEQPQGWQRSGRELMPNLGWDSLTTATFPLRPNGREGCAQIPEQALRDMGSDDALISLFFTDWDPAETPAWPTEFSVDTVEVLETSPIAECAGRSDLEIRSATRTLAGQAIYILVAFGTDAPSEVRARAGDVLSSFEPLGDTAEASAPSCVVTVPPVDQPLLPTTGSDAGPPAGQGWIGTPDLWTPLPYSGVHVRRKSVWWSQNFPGGGEEPMPPIEVTWKRTDAIRLPQVAESPGTNARTDGDGSFMVNGTDPNRAGCWKVTASYKDSTLSYVYWEPTPLGSEAEVTDRHMAVNDGSMPDLTGDTLYTLGDVEGVLYELQDLLGQQGTVYVANDEAEGIVVAQDPAPGTPLEDIDSWTVTVSSGGPVVVFSALPPEVADFARALEGFDIDESLIERETALGTVYKTDRWLFGLSCDAVDAAYRTFIDSRYDTACPGDDL